MTYRDMIIYILQNHLENEEVFKDGRIVGFMTIDEAAVKFNVGTSTIGAWLGMNMLQSFKIGTMIFIPENAVSPIERLKDNNNEKKITTNDVGVRNTSDFERIFTELMEPSSKRRRLDFH